MHFHLTEDQVMLRDMTSRLVQDLFAPTAGDAGSDLNLIEAAWRQLAELGLLRMAMPEDLGGLGGAPDYLMVLHRELGPAPLGLPLLPTAVSAARLLVHARPRPDALLEAIGGGTRLAAFAYPHGSDRPRGVSAVATDQGFVLDGIAACVPGCDAHTDTLLVAAWEEGKERPSVFVVDPHARGVMLDPYRLIDGSAAADMALDKVEVTASDRLLPIEEADTAIADATDHTLFAAACEMVGLMHGAVRLAREQLATRVQFGRPLSNFQAARHLLADMFVLAEQCQSLLLSAGADFAKGPAERSNGVAAAMAMISEAAVSVCQDAIQLHGAMGTTREHPVGRLYRRALVLSRLYGSAEQQLERYMAYGSSR